MEFFETCFARHDKKDTEIFTMKIGEQEYPDNLLPTYITDNLSPSNSS